LRVQRKQLPVSGQRLVVPAAELLQQPELQAAAQVERIPLNGRLQQFACLLEFRQREQGEAGRRQQSGIAGA
jgi:hypothetical protein